MANGEDTRNHPSRKVDIYAYRNKFDAALTKHMSGDSSDYEELLKSEGYITPSGNITGAGRTNPLARTKSNWDMD